MAIRYSKRQFDGTVEHYDTREEMEAANPSSDISLRDVRDIVTGISTTFNPLFAFFGFVIGAVVALLLMSQLDAWPTWARFCAVIASASVAGYIIGKIGNALLLLAIVTIGLAVIWGIGALVWHFL